MFRTRKVTISARFEEFRRRSREASVLWRGERVRVVNACVLREGWGGDGSSLLINGERSGRGAQIRYNNAI